MSFNLNSDQYADHVLVIEDTESARSWPMQNPRQVVRGTAAAMPAVRLRQAIADHRAAHFCDCDHREVKRGRSNETPSAYWTACTTAACLGTAAHFTNG